MTAGKPSSSPSASSWKFINNSAEDFSSVGKLIKKKSTKQTRPKAEWVNLYDAFVVNAQAASPQSPRSPSSPSSSCDQSSSLAKLRIDFLLC
eukprot:CAMPEP_0184649456 /NCGR_PEP_ID=MMETSP0308-20130426/6835_1 /TAXON_ID=38269 /ORGANISM="Gloeochaete witrockiana, Strain SAG 46.84" /LENGTH=91 /DNA_ID=CAMNT_0027082197 /DNA_START=47 /DNA_END=322 /DNA_ORIENTATION=+